MWLPRKIYELIPFYYLALGVAGLGAAFYLESPFWADVLAVGGLLALLLGLVVLLRRKGYRASRSRMDFDS